MANDLRLNTIEARVRRLDDNPVGVAQASIFTYSNKGGGIGTRDATGRSHPTDSGCRGPAIICAAPLITQESNLLIGGVLQTEQLVTEH